jgi:hypothetical protein
VPVTHLNESWGSVVSPVGYTVSDSKALEKGFEDSVILTVSSVVLVNVISHVGDIDSTVGLT